MGHLGVKIQGSEFRVLEGSFERERDGNPKTLIASLKAKTLDSGVHIAARLRGDFSQPLL